MEKEPVHEIEEVKGKLIVSRLKEPFFSAVYNAEKNELENIVADSKISDSLKNKALAFIKSQKVMKSKTA